MSKTIYHNDDATGLRLRATELSDGTFRVERAAGQSTTPRFVGYSRDGRERYATPRAYWFQTPYFIERVPNTHRELLVLQGREERIITVVGQTSVKTSLRKLAEVGQHL